MKFWKKILMSGAAVVFAAGLLTACSSDVKASFVTYDGQTVTLSGDAGSAIEFPVVEREGYLFKGWYTSEDYSGEAVSEALFDQDVTYYAKWAKGYAVNFDLDGGELTLAKTLYVEEGAKIASAVEGYVPVKGDLRFGGWSYNGETLGGNDKMPASSITLYANYEAEYTIDVYFQNIDDKTTEADESETYTKVPAYATGYYAVGEEFAPELTVTGYEFDALRDDKTELTISTDKEKNVFELYFNRKTFSLIYSSNYPDGSFEIRSETYRFEEEFELADYMFADVEGYRFFGWATRPGAGCSDVIAEETYSLTDDTVLYAVWNRGYTDLFGGQDYIFLNYDEAGTAVLSRGGVEIDGYYNEKKDIYVFEGNDLSLNVKINANGTFVYYSNRKGAYILFQNRYVYPDIVISLTDTDECYYSSSAEGDKFYKSGTYTIDENGIYTATLVDELSGEETTICFTIGTVSSSSGTVYNVFMIRGEEYGYGVMPMYYDGSFYYPTITLNGFGTALYQTTSGSTYYYYTIYDDLVVLSSTNSTVGTIRIKNYNGTYGYEIYNSEFDVTYTNGNAVLTLDGCSTAVYENGDVKVTGSFTYAESLIGEYVITVKSGNDSYVFLIDSDGVTFETKLSGYAEYYYANLTGYVTTPYLVVEGDGTASLYELDGSVPTVISTGTFTQSEDGLGYVYTVIGTVADWAQTQATRLTVMLDTTSTSYSLYYLLSSQTGNEDPVDYTTVYTSEDGSTLTLTAYFAIYRDATGNVFSGLITGDTDYISVSDGSAYCYFTLSEEGNTFVKLAAAPMELYMVDQNGKIQSSYKLTVNGTTVGDGKYYAVYSDASSETTVKYEGYYTAALVTSMGQSLYVYTFVANDGSKTFKFTVVTSSSNYYFYYYEPEEAITLGEFTAWTDSDEEDATSTITVTDLQENGKFVVLYTVNDVTLRGTYTSETVTAFDLYDVVVYTFTSDDGSQTVRFTLLGTYFRLCKETVTYTAADGSTLVLDGVTHIARYTVGAFVYDNYYQVLANTLDENDIAVAVYMSYEDTYYYFDLNSAEKTFLLRGAEAGGYYVVDNDQLTGYGIVLDGHGGAKIYDLSVEGDDYETADYTVANGLVTVFNGDSTVVGELGVNVYSDTSYYVFIVRLDVIAGTFYNEDDLTVIVLDGANGATYYSSYGVVEYGTYTIVSDSLFYFTNSDRSGIALFRYTYNRGGVGTFTAVGRNESYYANDFSSIIFSEGGVVTIDNSAVYLYEETDGVVRLYEYGGENPNEYGFSYTTFTIVDDGDLITITYRNKVYTYFYGGIIVLSDAEGNELTFQPTGEATFTVDATYTDQETGSKTSYYVVVDYDAAGEVYAILADSHAVYLNNSIQSYTVSFNYDITFDLVAGTFEVNEDETVCGFTAYDYMWAYYISYFGSGYSFLFSGLYGYISVMGEIVSGETVYTLSGSFNYLKDEAGNAVSFENGTLSRAGYYNSSYGNLFTTEFTGSDGETYHMSFFLYQMSSGLTCYIVYSLTRVTDAFEMADGSVIYSEELVYTLFSIPKSYDEEGNAVYFESGDEFYPSLRYRGELICCTSFEDLGNNEWVFVSNVYTITEDGKYYIPDIYYFYFNYTADELTGEIVSGAVTKRLQAQYDTADAAYTVYVLYDADGGEISEVYAIRTGNGTETATDCVKNSDGTFTVTTENGTYTVTITKGTDDDGNPTTTVTVTPVVSESGDE